MRRTRLLQDALLVVASIWAAWAIVHFNFVPQALAQAGDGLLWASLLAGLFFTSLLTTAPAIAVLGELSLEGNLFLIALVGSVGAVAGDYLLYAFVRDRVSQDAAYLLRGSRIRRALHIFKSRHFRRVLPVMGALIIASPLPDELGLALLGVSKLRTRTFLLIAYGMNFMGIVFIGLLARGLGW
ncbi:MAG: hypothetical protein JWL87_130 [Candidatus Adlerbacteria bacterium]|nr:hypothetical protein [Candidatus Adlerbacteria bacterium]